MEKLSDRNKDPNWIWGIIYYNKNDDRIFPPKRNPWMGWTVNFANPKSILVFVLVLLFFGSVSYMLSQI